MRLGNLTDYQVDGQTVVLDFEGKEVRIEAVTPRIINVYRGMKAQRTASKALEGSRSLPVSLDV